jgi:hypothetical protein
MIHQIEILSGARRLHGTYRNNSNELAVTCTCTGPPRRRLLIEVRAGAFPAAEAVAAWRDWHAREGIEL